MHSVYRVLQAKCWYNGGSLPNNKLIQGFYGCKHYKPHA
jgi:hypothetical protein